MNQSVWPDQVVQPGERRLMDCYGVLLAQLLGDSGQRDLASRLADLADQPPPLRLPIALGQAYEQTLGNWNGANSHSQPCRKSRGAYYTPVAIAQYMVQATLGPYLTAAPTPVFRILDPACGGGIFLVIAYQTLLDWRLQQWVAQLNPPSSADSPPRADWPIYRDSQGRWWLSRIEREQILRSHLFGVDLDPAAVEVARLALGFQLLLNGDMEREGDFSLPELGDRLCRGNALMEPGDQAEEYPTEERDGAFLWQATFPQAMAAGGFDVVVGNPPYLDSVGMSVHVPHWRRYCTHRYQTAVGNWDLFCVFIERAVALCRPGGRHSFVVPNKLASAEYTAAVRSLLAHTSQLLAIRDYSQTQAFAASVYPLVYVVRKREISQGTAFPTDDPRIACEIMADLQRVKTSQACAYRDFVSPSGTWLLRSAAVSSKPVNLQPNWPCLGAIAQILGAATVAEAYLLKEQMGDRPNPDPADLKVVNSGTLDPYALLWGQKPMQYLGDRYRHPVVSAPWLQSQLPTRYHQATQPKLIVAGLTKRLECGLDATGAFLAGKSTSIIQCQTVPLVVLLGLLNSAFVSQLFRHLFGGNGLSGGYLRVGPPQLRQLPIPPVARLQGQGGDRLMALAQQRLDLTSQQQSADQVAACDRAIDELVSDLYQGGRAIDD
ncbi:MAG: N-6 DNA methylase [Synechococcales bacterium]|nr:N-6 DNA methylase [Synechococcales bacterium]